VGPEVKQGAGTWFAGIAVAWSAAMMMLASLRVNRWEE